MVNVQHQAQAVARRLGRWQAQLAVCRRRCVAFESYAAQWVVDLAGPGSPVTRLSTASMCALLGMLVRHWLAASGHGDGSAGPSGEGGDMGADVFAQVPAPTLQHLFERANEAMLRQYVDAMQAHVLATASAEQNGDLEQRLVARLRAWRENIWAPLEHGQVLLTPRALFDGVQVANARLFQSLTADGLADDSERALMATVGRGGWVQQLSASDREALADYEQRWVGAQLQFEQCLGEYASLETFARHLARPVLRAAGIWLDPDALCVSSVYDDGRLVGQNTESLTDCLLRGPFAANPFMNRVWAANPFLRQPGDSANELLGQLEPRAGYLEGLAKRLEDATVLQALVAVHAARVEVGALLARFQGHLSEAGHQLVRNLASGAAAADEHVTTLSLEPGHPLADVLVFYGNRPDHPAGYILYAPRKPDGQEWIELPSARAVTAELGRWLADDQGSGFLLSKLAPASRASHAQRLLGAKDNSGHWQLDNDRRDPPQAYAEVLRVLAQRQVTLELQDSALEFCPPWYLGASEPRRAVINDLRETLALTQRASQARFKALEPFEDFARRRVTEAIGPYLREKGIAQDIDPSTILFAYDPSFAGNGDGTQDLLTLAMHGYDDNAGLDNERAPVKSSVGDDLSALKANDLARYIRSAYLGTAYAEAMAAAVLAADAPGYEQRRDAFANGVAWAFSLLGHQAHAQGVLSEHALAALLAALQAPDHQRVYRLTVGGYVLQGLWVMDLGGQRWLFTPDAPDGRPLRLYEGFAEGLSVAMHRYLCAFARVKEFTAVSRMLDSMAEGERAADPLQGSERVTSWRDEFNAQVRAVVRDVEDATLSRAEVRWAMVKKVGLYYAMALSFVSGWVSLGFSAWFIGKSLMGAYTAWRTDDTLAAAEQALVVSWGLLGGLAIRGLTTSSTIRSLVPGWMRIGPRGSWTLQLGGAGYRGASELALAGQLAGYSLRP
ncbi:dermonecrotic toxin domain-containing protein [Pseudomonas typographi]|uniref:Dermonecrotic toxin N-terminal domain-containing protein n=1 Tax=Pseudomonas typographi TaxID=2715964 RepID=A0ABR7Z7T0_9PSED|nr:DUF6543 domain-containing protein [Pseudomonas typographi]MBD1601515.1 hypothetical protein [Pseudomonas typographi]